ncbi:MAG: crossover junction endodeoxyribonuclease RuvC [Proteobacteria bacterium]|nr:crossover junction endodeoxyribonuclease RuvC [Pseudomonadota bacterium]
MSGGIRILGIDPGSQVTGFGLIVADGTRYSYVASGCIRTPSGDFAGRLREIFKQVGEVSRKHQPQEVAIEGVFLSKNAATALKLGQARAAAMCATFALDLPIFEYAPRQIKQSVVGTGKAEKVQVEHMVRVLLKLKGPIQSDAADALAVALCHASIRDSAIHRAAEQVQA